MANVFYKPVRFGGLVASANDIVTSASNQSVTLTLEALEDLFHIVHQLFCQYSSTPTNGKVTVKHGNDTIFELPITGTTRDFTFQSPLRAPGANTAMTITLAAGGSGVVGTLGVRHDTED